MLELKKNYNIVLRDLRPEILFLNKNGTNFEIVSF